MGFENMMLGLCLVLTIAAAGAKWQTTMMQKSRQRHALNMLQEREQITRRRGEAEMKLEEATLQERALNTDIRDFTHQLSIIDERLEELHGEEAELEERRQKREETGEE